MSLVRPQVPPVPSPIAWYRHICVLESRIVNQMRRTTIAAPADALATLEAEAVRRAVPLTAVIAEAINDKADALRRARRPRLGVGASARRSPGAAVAPSAPVADPPR